jgi:hypothetical protein
MIAGPGQELGQQYLGMLSKLGEQVVVLTRPGVWYITDWAVKQRRVNVVGPGGHFSLAALLHPPSAAASPQGPTAQQEQQQQSAQQQEEDEEEDGGERAHPEGDTEEQAAAESFGAAKAAQEATQAHNNRIQAVLDRSTFVKEGLQAWARATKKALISELQALRVAACKAFGLWGVYLGGSHAGQGTTLSGTMASSGKTGSAAHDASRRAQRYMHVYLGDVCSYEAQLTYQLQLLPHAVVHCRQLCKDAAEADEGEGEGEGAASGSASLLQLMEQLDVLLELEEHIPALLALMDVRYVRRCSTVNW